MNCKYPFLKLLHELGPLSTALTLVGGWVPTVYFEYLWKNQNSPFVTEDIDFALNKDIVWNQTLEKQIDQQHFKHRHLCMGKERPYQLLFENTPIDFLVDERDAKHVQESILGSGIILHATPDYRFLLENKLQVSCEGFVFHVPHPARYILHKTSVGLENLRFRSHDIATAYYVLTRSPEQNVIFKELKTLRKDAFYVLLRKQLSEVLDDPKLGLANKVVSHLREVGVNEDENDVRTDLLSLM